MPLPDL